MKILLRQEGVESYTMRTMLAMEVAQERCSAVVGNAADSTVVCLDLHFFLRGLSIVGCLLSPDVASVSPTEYTL